MRARPLFVLAIVTVLSGAPSAAFAADPSPSLRPAPSPPAGIDDDGPGSPGTPAQSPPASTIVGPGGATPAPQPADAVPADRDGPTIEADPAPAATADPAVALPTPVLAAPAGEVAVHVSATTAPASLASPHAIDRPPAGTTPAPAPIEKTEPAPGGEAAVRSPDFTLVSLIAGITALALSAVLLLLAVWRRGLEAAAASATEGSGEERVAALLRRRTERLGRIPIEDDPIVAALNIPPTSSITAERADGRRRRRRSA